MKKIRCDLGRASDAEISPRHRDDPRWPSCGLSRHPIQRSHSKRCNVASGCRGRIAACVKSLKRLRGFHLAPPRNEDLRKFSRLPSFGCFEQGSHPEALVPRGNDRRRGGAGRGFAVLAPSNCRLQRGARVVAGLCRTDRRSGRVRIPLLSGEWLEGPRVSLCKPRREKVKLKKICRDFVDSNFFVFENVDSGVGGCVYCQRTLLR